MAKGEEKEEVRPTDWQFMGCIAGFVALVVILLLLKDSKAGWFVLPVAAPLSWFANRRIQKTGKTEQAYIRIKSVKPRKDSYP